MPGSYSQKTAALIPAYNDDYSLLLCLQSVAPFFDEVWVFDDYSDDKTAVVIDRSRSRFNNIGSVRTSSQEGWTNSINRLLTMTDARYVFRIDADDIMYPGAAEDLERIIKDENPYLLLGLRECWGDFHHSRRGLNICHDPTHLYVDRARVEIRWNRGPAPTFWPIVKASAEPRFWPTALFFHTPGVKSNKRIVLRTLIGEWESAGRPCPLVEWPEYKKLSEEAIHDRALHWLLFHNNKRRIVTKIPQEVIPDICQKNDRFKLIWDDNGHIVERQDRGWLFGS